MRDKFQVILYYNALLCEISIAVFFFFFYILALPLAAFVKRVSCRFANFTEHAKSEQVFFFFF